MGDVRTVGVVTDGSAITAAPTLSPRLREVFEQLSRTQDQQCDIMLEAIRVAVPAYAMITDKQLLSDMREGLRANLAIWYRAVLHGPPSAEDMATMAADARRHYYRGTPLGPLQHSFRVAINANWNNVVLECARRDPSIQAEMLLNVTSYVLQYIDLLGQTLSRAYYEESQKNLRWHDQRQQELCSLIFDRPGDEKRFQELTSALRIDPVGRRAALVFDVGDSVPGDHQSESRLDELLHQIVERFDATKHSPRSIRSGRLVCWTPVPATESAVQYERYLASACERLVQETGDAIVAVGIGFGGVDALGWRASAEQAMRALELGTARARGNRRVFRYSEVLIEDAATTPGHNHEYFEDLLRLLQGEPELLETLRTWLSTPGLTRKVAAATLAIHPNTLDYRLRKIAEKLGADLDDISWLTRLYVALQRRERGPSNSEG